MFGSNIRQAYDTEKLLMQLQQMSVESRLFLDPLSATERFQRQPSTAEATAGGSTEGNTGRADAGFESSQGLELDRKKAYYTGLVEKELALNQQLRNQKAPVLAVSLTTSKSKSQVVKPDSGLVHIFQRDTGPVSLQRSPAANFSALLEGPCHE